METGEIHVNLWSEIDVQARLEKFHADVDYTIVAEIIENYMVEHDVRPGATPEQIEQINSNTARLDLIEESYVRSVGDLVGDVPAATDDDIELILNGGYAHA